MSRFLAHVVFFAMLALITTGCFELEETLNIQKDGSGSYTLTAYSNALFDNADMQALLKSSRSTTLDTLVNVQALVGPLPAALNAEQRAVLLRTQLRLHLDADTKMAYVQLRLPFEQLDEVNTLTAAVGHLSEAATTQPSGAFSQVLSQYVFPLLSIWHLDKHSLQRNPSSAVEQPATAPLSLTTTVELPGKIKKCTLEGAVIGRNSVMTKHALGEYIGRSGEVQYK